MNLNNTRTLGYDGPLGWPSVDPTEVNNTYITTQGYTRTENEKVEVDMSSDTTSTFDIDNVDKDLLLAKERAVLEMRFKIDELWETMSSEILSFSSNYLRDNSSTSSSNFNITSLDQYESAMKAILQIQAYATTINNYFHYLEETNESWGDNQAYKIIDNAARYSTGAGDTDGYEDTSTGFWGWLSNLLTKAGVSGFTSTENPTMGMGTAVASQQISENMQEAHSMTVTEAISAFANYTTWIEQIRESLENSTITEQISAYEYQGDFPRDVKNISAENNLLQFQQDAYILDAMMCKNQVRSVWVFLQIGNIKFSTWNESNYITDFDYKKNGAGAANSFTFNLAYAPPPGDSNINRLEKILSKRKVFFQYGYNESKNLCSPQYSGQILEYSVSTANNMLLYTIVGYSEAAESRNVNIAVPGFGERFVDTDEEGNEVEGDVAIGIKATTYAQQILTMYLGSEYVVEVEKEADEANTATVIEPTSGSVFECVRDILSQAVLTETMKNTISEKEKKSQELEEKTGVDMPSTTSDDTTYFTYVINDIPNDEGYKTITIKRAMKLVELQNDDLTVSLVFTYGGKQEQTKLISDIGADLTTETEYDYGDYESINAYYNDLLSSSSKYSKGTYKMLSNVILDFSTEYTGAVTIAQSYVNTSKQLSIDASGNIVLSNAIGARDVTAETSEADEFYSFWLWERNTMYSYNATLTMLGIPSDIPIGTYIYIRPIINGYEHHTGGFYYITGSEDKVTQDGYTTTLSLLKVVDQDTDEILKAINTLKEGKISYANYVLVADQYESYGRMGYYVWAQEQKQAAAKASK